MRRLALVCSALLLAGLTACTDSPIKETTARTDPSAAATSAAPKAPETCDARASFRPTQGVRMPAGSYMQEIRKRGRLVLGTTQDTLLFSSRDPFTGRIEGFDVDMGREIAEAIFGDPDKLEIRVVPRSNRVNAVVDGDVDLAISTMTTNCARWELVDFSTVYFEAGQRVLVGKDSAVTKIEDLGKRPVCAATGSTSLENIAKVSTGPVPVARADFGECLVAFQLGEVDAISTDDTILAGLATQDPYAKVVGPKFTSEPYAAAVAKGHPEFTEFVNAVFERLRSDGTWQKIYDKWLTTPAPQPPAAKYR
ncbi:glutamate ABC transporter substrate-binding protein [Actinoplanes derwentensis]|uniref:Amino acid ABC transporter substrate-binding protein, PAAT family n=1 Tax=Actinoplanes derwentensis TaxID=113562 RepID=A0A1H1Q8M6_9ACTN|nr:glutamate ABC transporter substrate-binding protein [Actinoplanes derwentensis]GID82203.1 putative glutamine-binding protein GlnH [Actinoplanes derwentensis]SDS19868.1 amino acid ABC transporter substrate-binding protein, PAAT family [Actinoplanes derwentensis]